jgi:hypothetical protein
MWYAVVEKATGKLYSTSTEIADPMPSKFKVIELGEDFDEEWKVWNVASQAFVHQETPQEEKVRWLAERTAKANAAATELLAMPGMSKLTVAQQSALKTKLLSYLAPTTGAQ